MIKNLGEKLNERVHPKQLQKQYGGEAKDCTNFWPPQEVSTEYGVDPDKLMDLPEENPKDKTVPEINLFKDSSFHNRENAVGAGAGMLKFFILL